jgi:hypothetical protein
MTGAQLHFRDGGVGIAEEQTWARFQISFKDAQNFRMVDFIPFLLHLHMSFWLACSIGFF